MRLASACLLALLIEICLVTASGEVLISQIYWVDSIRLFLMMNVQKDNHIKSNGSERTLVLLKPDAVVRGHVGASITIFEQCGLHIENLRVFEKVPTETLQEHYREHEGKGFYQELIEYMSSGPVVAVQVVFSVVYCLILVPYRHFYLFCPNPDS